MNFKIIVLIISFVISSGAAFTAEKWNVLIASWEDKSLKPDRSVGLILQKSITSALDGRENFRVVAELLTNVPVAGYEEASERGHSARADVIVYGSYYIEKDKLFVTAEVYDVLENRLRMEKVYTGLVTADIFDTIDSMSSDMVKKIEEALPAMTAESETRVKKIRETLYETKRVDIKRELYTRFGIISSMGMKNLNWNMYGGSNPSSVTNQFSGSWPITSLDLGLGFRYWDVRLDFEVTGLPGLPYYDWNQNTFGASQQVPTYVSLTGSYYLPWFGETLAIGFGVVFQNELVSTNSGNSYDNQLYSAKTYPGFPYTFIIIWNPVHELELTLEFSPLFAISGDNNQDNGQGSEAMSYDFPPLSVGATYFFGDLGIMVKFTYDHGNYYSWGMNNGWINFDNNINYLSDNSSFQDFLISVDFVYRVDFL